MLKGSIDFWCWAWFNLLCFSPVVVIFFLVLRYLNRKEDAHD